MAGQRGKCPKCSTPITIPKPNQSVDDLAAAAWADDPNDEPATKTSRYSTPEPLPKSSRAPSAVANSGYGVQTAAQPAASSKPKQRGASFEYRAKEPETRRSRGVSRINQNTIVGLLMILGAAVWFVLGLAAGRIFFYPPILAVFGIVQMVRGLLGDEGE